MAGLLSKDIKLKYSSSITAPISYTEIDNVREVPDLGATPDQIDVTCLRDANMKSIPGLVDFGSLEFTLLYDNSGANSNFRVLKGLEGDLCAWEVEFPDGTKFDFLGYPSVRTNGAAANAAIEFTLAITVNSDFTVVNPS